MPAITKKALYASKGRLPYDPDAVSMMLSGGIDSTVLAYWLAQQKHSRVYAFFVHSGAPNTRREFQSANRTAKILGFHLIELDFSWQTHVLAGISAGAEQDPEEHEPTLGELSRASAKLLLSCADMSEAHGSFKLFHGMNSDDLKRYTFFQTVRGHVEEIISLGNPQRFVVSLPYEDKSSADVVSLGVGLAVTFADTWSCYSNHDRHCGRCAGCKRRKARLASARVVDETKYEA